LDALFGTGGRVTIDFGTGMTSTAGSVAVRSDGKILVAGATGGSFAVALYSSAGTLDPSFGTGGVVTTVFPPTVTVTQGSDILLEDDGEVIVTGLGTVPGPPRTTRVPLPISFMTRYTSNGTLDTAFGTNGIIVFPTGFSLSREGFIQSDGKIVFATQNVFRLKSDGSLDTNFGQNGFATPPFPISGHLVGAALQPDGKIIAAGDASSGFALLRFNPDGSFDSTFGVGGKATTDFSFMIHNAADMLVQPNGRVIVAGTSDQGVATDFALARFLPDNVGLPNQRFVEQIYWDLLRRPVDSSGLAAWTGPLDQGRSRLQIVTAIQSSPEYHTIKVQDLYQLVLGRTPDASGLATWVSFLNGAGTAEQLEAILLGSAEFFVAHGSDNNAGFLPALYQLILQRPIDSSGAQTWGQALQSGALSRQAVAAALLASPESDQLEVQSLYMQFLRRTADPGGLDTFTTALQRGVNNEQVALILMGSAEYLSRV